MYEIDRRSLLMVAGATLASATFAVPRAVAREGKPPWKKAFMLGGLSKGPVLDQFKLLRDAGFEGVELLSPNGFDLDEVLKARDETGLVIHGISGSVHWNSPLSSPDPSVVEKGLAAIRKSISDCKSYGGTTVLLVPAVVNPQVSHREAYARSQENIRKVIPEAEAAGIKIAIEEVWNKFLLSAPEFARYVDEFKTPAVGAYFDVGNVVEYGYPQEWIRELGKRILKIHIKEYAKSKRFSYPLGEGEIDWPAVRSALIDIGYEGWITAEVGLGDLAVMKDVVARMDKILGLA
ncbi:sugar phosphate isomerase/epimerase family protein [Tundrisphaera lichenicola]|uniref:sugar phosphate isomerase/epimerase family protein n=1 Tax=Tundrisphaera lichenicola TaxID=2029860 RepID=UPI003EB9CDCB